MAAGTQSFLAEVALVPFNFAPNGWATCNGQLMSISQNTALFSLLGTNYGGNGTSTFGLPNFQGAVVIGAGTQGANSYVVGQSGGTVTNTLLLTNLPAHSHAVTAPLAPPSGTAVTTNTPVGNFPGAGSGNLYSATTGGSGGSIPMVTGAVTAANTGGNQSYNNMQTYLGVNYIIALQGIFPPRS